MLQAAAGLALYLTLALIGPLRPMTPILLAGVALGFALLIWVRRSLRQKRLNLRWLLVICLLVRIPLIMTPPSLSEDLYRYLWDGALLADGDNPFLQAPEDMPEAQQRYPDLYREMAHTNLPSIYPPLAQVTFLANHWLWGPSSVGWKLFLLLAEALAIAAWRRSGADWSNISLWAINPLVILEFHSSGHLDVLALALLAVATIVTFAPTTSGRRWGGPLLLAAATLVKIFPLFLFPLFVRAQGSIREILRFALYATAALLVGTALFLAVLGDPWESWTSFRSVFETYRDHWRFNSPFFLAFESTRHEWGHRPEYLFMSGALLLAFHRDLRWLLRSPRPEGRTLSRSAGLEEGASLIYLTLMILTALSHTVHPWYVTWSLAAYPLLGLRYWAGIYLSGAVFLSYLAYWFSPPAVVERMDLLLVEWIPFYCLLARDLVVFARQEWLTPGPSAARR